MEEKKLYHLYSDMVDDFFKRIDEFGGWPHNAGSVVMRHTGIGGERPCYFSEGKNIRDEWNTGIYGEVLGKFSS